MFPSRDDVVAHLERAAGEDGIELRLGAEVQRIERRVRGWRVHTATGDIDSRQVVVATGYQHTPRIPEWPGTAGFTGDVLHSSQYRNPAPYRGRNVLVFGSGSPGMEIADDLATGGAAKVWKAGSVEVVATVESFDGNEVVLVDGSRLDPHAVVLATGYTAGLEAVVGHPGVLDEKGKPVIWGEQPAATGLRFIGYDVRRSLIGYVAK